MSYASPAISGDFRVGNVLNHAFQICVGNFPFFFIITFVIGLPNLLITLNQPVGQPPELGPILRLLGITLILGLVLNTIGEAVILYGAFQRLSGRPLQPAEAFQRALARFFPLLGLALLYALALVFGLVLLLVPGFILLVMWAVVVPACLVEGLGPIESMSRSAALTKGHRWQIFGIMIVLGIVNWIGTVVLGFVLRPAGPVVAALVTLVWTAAWAAYWNCLLIMIYHDLRVAKEGIGTQQIAAVFD
ncbi:MAG TPA: hypothetical protein VII40_18885 [Xanthobacteraceae bacterium]